MKIFLLIVFLTFAVDCLIGNIQHYYRKHKESR